MSQLRSRIDQLFNLRDDLKKEGPDTQVTVGPYIELLTYHIDLLREVDQLADSFANNNVEDIQKWYNYRVLNLTK